jgi:hypothetical protein
MACGQLVSVRVASMQSRSRSLLSFLRIDHIFHGTTNASMFDLDQNLILPHPRKKLLNFVGGIYRHVLPIDSSVSRKSYEAFLE